MMQKIQWNFNLTMRGVDNSLIGFTYFPTRGDILMEVIDCDKLGIKEIKEFSCWKYFYWSSQAKIIMIDSIGVS